MLENMRQKSGSFIIWILFAIIIAAFVLFFGPQSEGGLACGASKDMAMEVGDEEVSMNSYRFAFNGVGLLANIPGQQRRSLALDLLLQREILAQEAEKLGFQITDEVLDEALAKGEFYLAGRRIDGSAFYFERDENNKPTYFSFEILERLAQGSLGLPSVAELRKQQRREMLANFMRMELLSSGNISEEEAQSIYVLGSTRISAEYVKFETGRYRAGLQLTEADIQAYADTHGEELSKDWETAKAQWATDKPRLRGRIIKVAKNEPAPAPAVEDNIKDDEGAAGSETTGETPATPPAAEATPAEPAPAAPATEATPAAPATEAKPAAKDKIETALAAIQGGRSFAEVAAEYSEDRTASLGGSIGWRNADSLGYGNELVEAVKGLEVGKVSSVIEAPAAYYLFVVEERSDKALSFEQMKLQLARQKAPEEYGKRLARAAAEEALAKAKVTPLNELFKEAPASPGFNLEDLEKLPPELREQLLQQMLQQSEQEGAIYVEGRNRLAQAAGDKAPPAKPAAAAKPAPAAVAEPAPAKPAVAKPAPAKPAAVGQPLPASPATVAASKEAAAPQATAAVGADSLPRAEVEPPSLGVIRGTTRNGDSVTGIGRSQEIVDALFGTLSAGELSETIYEVSEPEGFVIVRLTSREEADLEKFKEEAGELRQNLALTKGQEILSTWLLRRCQELKQVDEISHNQDILLVEDNKVLPYEPCALFEQ